MDILTIRTDVTILTDANLFQTDKQTIRTDAIVFQWMDEPFKQMLIFFRRDSETIRNS